MSPSGASVSTASTLSQTCAGPHYMNVSLADDSNVIKNTTGESPLQYHFSGQYSHVHDSLVEDGNITQVTTRDSCEQKDVTANTNESRDYDDNSKFFTCTMEINPGVLNDTQEKTSSPNN